MGFFDRFRGASQQPLTQATEKTLGSFAFSTPFGVIGGGNLSLPHVNKYYTQNGFVRFGSDNLYPQLLNQLYFTSAIHGACLDFTVNAIIGGGYELVTDKMNGVEKVNLMTFEKINKFPKLVKTLTRDYTIHRRVCVIVHRKNGKFVKFTRIDPSTVRSNVDVSKFVYSSDWSKGTIDSREYHKYNPNSKMDETLYVFNDNTPGQDIYPIPGYNSILNWAYLDGEQSFFHKSNIQNSVFPSAVVRRPKEFGSIDEVNQFKEEISSKTGASNAGRLLVLTGNSMEDVPEFLEVSANSNDKLFEGTAKELKENVCFAHKINPSIMGIKVAGSLGNSEELTTSYKIFEKNVVMPERVTMSEIFNDLLEIADVKQKLTINNFQIVGEVMIELPEEVNKINKTIAALDPVIQSKVLENMTQNEIRNLAGLKPIITAETNVDGTPVEVKAEVEVNDNLKGLSAADNADMYRIIRDHSKGKLNDVLAIARLKSYGLSDEQAKEILGINQ